MPIATSVAKKIIAYAGKSGRPSAVKKYGKEQVDEATTILKRRQRRKFAKAEAAKKKAERQGGGASAAKKTPTGTRRSRKTLARTPKEEARRQSEAAKRARDDEATTTVYGSREKGTPKKVRTRKQARDLVSRSENESGSEFMGRISRQAEQMGVGSGRRFGKDDTRYTREQIDSMMRGEYSSPEETTKDVLEMMEERVGRRKKGGKVAKKKSSSKPRGVGMALRGYGRAMKGTK